LAERLTSSPRPGIRAGGVLRRRPRIAAGMSRRAGLGRLGSGAGPSRSWSCRDFRLSAASRIQASRRRCRYINRNVRLASRQ